MAEAWIKLARNKNAYLSIVSASLIVTLLLCNGYLIKQSIEKMIKAKGNYQYTANIFISCENGNVSAVDIENIIKYMNAFSSEKKNINAMISNKNITIDFSDHFSDNLETLIYDDEDEGAYVGNIYKTLKDKVISLGEYDFRIKGIYSDYGDSNEIEKIVIPWRLLGVSEKNYFKNAIKDDVNSIEGICICVGSEFDNNSEITLFENALDDMNITYNRNQNSENESTSRLNTSKQVFALLSILISIIYCVVISFYWIITRKKEFFIRIVIGYDYFRLGSIAIAELMKALISSTILFLIIEPFVFWSLNRFIKTESVFSIISIYVGSLCAFYAIVLCVTMFMLVIFYDIKSNSVFRLIRKEKRR